MIPNTQYPTCYDLFLIFLIITKYNSLTSVFIIAMKGSQSVPSSEPFTSRMHVGSALPNTPWPGCEI
jgi:hypothetical protein